MTFNKKILVLIFGAIFSIFFFSCKNPVSKGDSSSFISALDIVDALISTGETSEAIKHLKKTEKKAFSSYARLSVFKRYIQLGDEKNGEAVLQTALKKLPKNPEISAVYAQFLLRREKIEEATRIAECLKDSKYGSIFSECFFKSKKLQYEKDKSPKTYLESDMEKVYKDAFDGTGDDCWLINHALVNLCEGKYSKAASLTPDKFGVDDYFWGLVNFDAGNFTTAIALFEEAASGKKYSVGAKYSLGDSGKFGKEDTDKIAKDIKFLIADCYEFLGDSDTSQEQRNLIFKENSKIETPTLYLNGALWAQSKNDRMFEYQMLISLVNEFPEYVPGLAAYGDFSVESNKDRPQTSLERTLQDKNIKTKQMSAYDSIPKVPVEDPIFRMRSVLETQKEIEKKVDYNLVVALKELQHKLYYSYSSTTKYADIWRTLEEYSTGKNLYPEAIAHWAICKFLESGEEKKIEEVKNIFEPYLNEKYLKRLDAIESEKAKTVINSAGEEVVVDVFGGEKPKKKQPNEYEKMTFYEKIASVVSEMEVWESEIAAFFAIRNNEIASGKRLLEYVCNETAYKNQVSPSSKVNLAMLLSSSGEKQKALSLYGEALGKTKNSEIKAEILYRMAKAQLELGDNRSAILSLEYCISQDPNHASARLLLGKIK